VLDPAKLPERLKALPPGPWQGTTFRHMFGSYPPDRENTSGARWNPAGVAAIYASLTREGALAEAEHQIAVQPIRPRARRSLYELEVALSSVLDLTDRALLAELDVDEEGLRADDMLACREVGAAAASLNCEGILVPSARAEATNLVIFAANLGADARFDVQGREELPDRTHP
jgi:RES domain-containing protein